MSKIFYLLGPVRLCIRSNTELVQLLSTFYSLYKGIYHWEITRNGEV